MPAFETFRDYLQETLSHLYDPTHDPHPILWTVTGCDPKEGFEHLRDTLIRCIEALRPGEDVPETARSWRIYSVLYHRYIRNLTQAEAAEHLNITPRHLRREQKSSVNVLAERLWKTQDGSPALGSGRSEQQETQSETKQEPEGWRDQLQQELTVLQDGSTRSIADVSYTMRRAAESTRTLTDQQKTRVVIEDSTEEALAAINPSALRQIVIIGICKLAKFIDGGEITLRSELKGDRIRISVTGHPILPQAEPSSEVIQEMVAMAKDGDVEIVSDNRHVTVNVELPAATMTRVLVIDDNQDLVHFFHRYTTGTRYQIESAVSEEAIFDLIDRDPPDVIVLDVMLPDVDGWELLAHLHEYPATRETPIILCSVIREEELALALGATLYLPKPVHRQDFIHALDRATEHQSATTHQSAPTKTTPS